MARTSADDWVPAACTLPTAAQPLRRAEFDEMFLTAVRRSIRTRTTRLDLIISPESEVYARDLAERETACCSFFRFDFRPMDDGLIMQIGVPDNQVEVLDALEARLAAHV